MNLKNIFQRYLFRRDFFLKLREKIDWIIRKNTRNALKDQRRLLNNLESGIILDVGAHIGETTESYRKYFPKHKIVCFEPFLESHDYLKMRFINDSNINIIDTALGIKAETKPLYVSNFTNLNSLQRPNERAWGFADKKSIDVEITTLDQFCYDNDIEYIDILKLDVQGSELDVLMGSKTLLEKGNISLIYAEWQVVPLYKEHHEYYKIAEFLAGYEYQFYNLYNINESRSGQIRWADAIYTSKGLRDKMISRFGEGTGSGW
ncbi:FkbM family methyltransferase [Candidatus Marinimicrobia bacterium]|nr:FkbM family methyltransferase [Candidatus Neomarinimicrobiota bacterium]